LAPGADVAVAELFLKLKDQQERDYELIVPLPYDKEQYTHSFKKDEDRKRFNSLLSKAAKHFIVTGRECVDDSSRYRYSGQFVADSSMLLIAIWDKETNNKKGGTADIDKYKIDGSFEDDNIETIFDICGSLIELHCNRETEKPPKELELPTRPLIEVITENKSITKALDKTESLNRQHTKVDPGSVSDSRRFLYPDTSGINDDNVLLREYFSLIDAQAIASQKKYKNSLGSLFVFGFFIISFFECYKHLHQPISLLSATIGLLLLAFLISRVAHRRKYHSTYLENRVLAEAIRIQFFWNLGNVEKNVSNYILRIYNAEFSWLKHILQALRGVAFNQSESSVPPDQIVTHWLKSQNDYFKKKRAQIIHDEHKYQAGARWSMLLAIAFLVALVILYLPICTEHEREEWRHLVIVGIGILFGVFALCKAYVEKKGYQQTINQYSLMTDIFGAAIAKIEDIQHGTENASNKRKRIKSILFLAGKEALIENGNWYLIYKEKEPEMEGLG
jgi:hypothetical protein